MRKYILPIIIIILGLSTGGLNIQGEYSGYLATPGVNAVMSGRSFYYGKDFYRIAAYFDNDYERTYQALLRWQLEYKKLCGKDKTIEQLSTFRDDEAHTNGIEYFLVTDENGTYTGEIRPRDLCHVDGTWHMVVFVYLIDSEGRVLIQKRSQNKSYFKGCYSVSAGGHVGLDPDPRIGAQRETQEEIFRSKITIDPRRFIQINETSSLRHVFSNAARPHDNEKVTVYLLPVTDEEKANVDYDPVEVDGEGCGWYEFEDVMDDYLINPDQYAADFITMFAQTKNRAFVHRNILSRVKYCINKIRRHDIAWLKHPTFDNHKSRPLVGSVKDTTHRAMPTSY